MIPGSGERTVTVLLHRSVTAKVRTGLFGTFRALTRMSNARHPGGAPVASVVNSFDVLSMGPLWHNAHTPFLLGGVHGASTKNSRPRFSDAVWPSGRAGGGPPRAKALSALLEKNRLLVRWNSAIASSSAAVGATVACAWRVIAPEA